MENIKRYIKEVKSYLEKNPNLTETEIIRYIYLDLGNMLSFDLNYIPFGNSKKRQEIYKNGFLPSLVDECFKNKIVICNSASKINELVGDALGINIKTVRAIDDIRKYPHVYNIVTLKDTNEKFIVDLQEDMYRIQMHGTTPSFGLSYRR